MANSPRFPLKVLDDFTKLKSICKDFVNSKSNLLSINISQDYEITISEKFNKYDFAFFITSLRFQNNKTRIAVHYNPASDISNEKTGQALDIDDILPLLIHWTSLIERHYKHHPNEVLLNELTESYFEDYKIYDPDADTATFNAEQQKALCYFAEVLEETLSQEINKDESIKEIISDTRNFKNNLDSAPKNVLMKSYSKIVAKMHLKAPGLPKKIFLKVQDALISYAVEKGVHSIVDLGIRLIMTHSG